LGGAYQLGGASIRGCGCIGGCALFEDGE